MAQAASREATEFFIVPRSVREEIISRGCKHMGLFLHPPNLSSDEKKFYFLRCKVAGLCAIARTNGCKGSHPAVVQETCPDGIPIEGLVAFGLAASGIVHLEPYATVENET